MSTFPSMTNPMEQRRESASLELAAAHAAIAIVKMDPHAREDLVCHIQELGEAKSHNETKSIAYLMEAIREIFVHSSFEDIGQAPDLAQFEDRSSATVQGLKARQSVQASLESFQARYREAKAAAGLSTQRQVAKAAGISLSTVQAVESGKVRPQHRTIVSLANAFGVSVSFLSTDLWYPEKTSPPIQ